MSSRPRLEKSGRKYPKEEEGLSMNDESNSDSPRAVIRKALDQWVLDDPNVRELVASIRRLNCKHTLKLNADRVAHFKKRFAEWDMTADKVVIALINPVDVPSNKVVRILIPSYNWQLSRGQGQVPFTCGLFLREGIQEILDRIDEIAAARLRDTTDVVVVVIDFGTVEIFPA